MNILTDIRDFLFPRLCMACGRKLQVSEQALCCDCLSQLPHTHLGSTPGNEMEKIFWGRFPIQRASALFYYARGGKVAHILAGMKYYGRQKVCRQMGEMLAHELLPTGFFEGVDYLLPVPLHPGRLRTRGYNQSRLLAEGISEQTGIPVCDGLLCRVRNNQTQTHKSVLERQENTVHLFHLAGDTRMLQGKHVMLVDDVLTTGATLGACADVLADIEGISISIVTLAWTK